MLAGLLVATLSLGGCAVQNPGSPDSADMDHYRALAELTNYGGAEYGLSTADQLITHADVPPPLTLDQESFESWPLSPDDAVRIALSNSKILRDLGGTILRAPDDVRTIHGPAIKETDPRFGVEAALSAFDAQLAVSSLLEHNDRAVNNRFLAGTRNIFTQDLFNGETTLSKRAATGAELTARQRIEYDKNNITGNLFPKAWTTIYETEIRQPLLQGAGWRFNRVAGPLSIPGVANGVVLARLNTDISLVDFRLGIRELLSSVENAYWDLYFAYRDLDAKIAARDASLRTWRRIKAQADLPGGVSERESQAREQYYRFQQEVEDALSGRLVERTRSNNGSSGGTFRGVPGVLAAERRLRLVMGVPINDGRLIRPSIDPPLVRVLFDWNDISAEAVLRRPELEKQRLVVKRRELELLANRNHLLPRLDAIGRYRWRGFGEDLLDPDRADGQRFDNAYQDLTTGDFQEWQLAMELSFPVGFRRAHAAVHNSKLQLARDRAVLTEQEQQVVHDLSNAISELSRAYQVAKTAFNRQAAAAETRKVLEERERLGGKVDLYFLLDAQRREADAQISYYRAMVEYALAVKNVHYEKGSLLDFNNVFLSQCM
jgi:outer membrane protein TolC